MSSIKSSVSNPPDEDGDTDWHPADVHAALKKRGYSLAALSVAAGYHPTAAGKALKRPWPALEALIATAIGSTPQAIWPTRYAGGSAQYPGSGISRSE